MMNDERTKEIEKQLITSKLDAAKQYLKKVEGEASKIKEAKLIVKEAELNRLNTAVNALEELKTSLSLEFNQRNEHIKTSLNDLSFYYRSSNKYTYIGKSYAISKNSELINNVLKAQKMFNITNDDATLNNMNIFNLDDKQLNDLEQRLNKTKEDLNAFKLELEKIEKY